MSVAVNKVIRVGTYRPCSIILESIMLEFSSLERGEGNPRHSRPSHRFSCIRSQVQQSTQSVKFDVVIYLSDKALDPVNKQPTV